MYNFSLLCGISGKIEENECKGNILESEISFAVEITEVESKPPLNSNPNL